MSTAAADPLPVPRDETETPFRDRLETVLAILLGLAAVLVAWTSYQGSLRGGDSIKSFNEGIRSISDANAYFNEAVQVTSRDQAVFLEYAKAVQNDDTDLATYLQTSIMDDNLRGAVQEWLDDDTNEIASPLEAPSYAVPQQDEGQRLEALTEAQFNDARTLDDEGDKYDLVGVIVASALFFLGIAAVVRNMRTKIVGASLGAIALGLSVVLWLMI